MKIKIEILSKTKTGALCDLWIGTAYSGAVNLSFDTLYKLEESIEARSAEVELIDATTGR